MKPSHLTDEEIQEYLLAGSPMDIVTSEHLSSCEKCGARLRDYQFLFTEITKQQRDVFDFNLAEMVVAQISSRIPKKSSDNFPVYLVIVPIAILGAVAAFYFRNYIIGLFSGIMPVFIYVTLTAICTVSVLLGLDMYTSYQRKIASLDII